MRKLFVQNLFQVKDKPRLIILCLAQKCLDLAETFRKCSSHGFEMNNGRTMNSGVLTKSWFLLNDPFPII